MIVGNCWSCSEELEQADFTRAAVCPSCGRDTRVCKACVFYDPKYNNECRENQADRIVEKEKSNFCDYFKAAKREKILDDKNRKLEAAAQLFGETASQDNEKNDPKAAAEALFKKK